MNDFDLLIPRPDYSSAADFIDKDIKIISEYLFNEVNTTFQPVLNKRIVKTVKPFNDVGMPLTDYPVLKIYRLSEQDTILIHPALYVDLNINYILAYTTDQKVADISSLVAKEIRRLLKNASILGMFQLDENTGINIEYDTMINPDNIVYKYTTVTCKILTTDS